MSFYVDWTSPHVATWREYLGQFVGKPRVSALEIGVLEGRSTVWFCENILTGDGSTIECVDPFLQTHDSGFKMRREGYDEATQRFRDNTRHLGEKVHLHHMRSIEFFAQEKLATPRFDFAYIDGSHTLVDASTDLFWVWGMTKPGGVIIVDDYKYTDVIKLSEDDVIIPGVTEACDAWLQATKCEVLHKGAQLIARKKFAEAVTS